MIGLSLIGLGDITALGPCHSSPRSLHLRIYQIYLSSSITYHFFNTVNELRVIDAGDR